MQLLKDIDLRLDDTARYYVKHEQVRVTFASATGELVSREGPNRYVIGDALITSDNGDTWCVSRDRFEQKYEPLAGLSPGENGAYRNKPLPVLAKQMSEPFSIARCVGGDVLYGAFGDWLMQYAPGDFGITENSRFQRVYRLVQR